MRIAFLNPQGNFDPADSYWTEHPDFGGQLVYVKEVAIAMAELGHEVDILTRQIVDPAWPEFAASLDAYPGVDRVRIVRLPCGPKRFLRKEELWPFLGTEWIPNIIDFYAREEPHPNAATAHYGDGGLAGALWQAQGGPPFTFTAHSLGAQKLDRLLLKREASLAELDAHYHFARRIAAERVSMNRAIRIITSTRQERGEQYSHAAYRDAVNPADDGKFAVVPPGVNLRIFGAQVHGPHDEQIASHLEEMLARDIDPERRQLPAILCSSRLDPKKNHVGLVQAFARSQELRRNANLLIVVRGAEDIHSHKGLAAPERAVLDGIVKVCESHNLWGQVSAFSLNSQYELAAAYRHLSTRRSVFALTALYEPFGLAPLEAIAAGLPVAVTRNGGPSESLYEKETGREFGILVDPTDPDDIAAGLLRLIGPRNEWETFQQVGTERVMARYTWEGTAAGYLSVIQSALQAEAPAGPPSPNQVERLAIPTYFWDPRPETDLTPKSLSAAWPDKG
jgi:sucrose-phosphate synthase